MKEHWVPCTMPVCPLVCLSLGKARALTNKSNDGRRRALQEQPQNYTYEGNNAYSHQPGIRGNTPIKSLMKGWIQTNFTGIAPTVST